MRLPFIAATLIVLLASPFVAIADDDEDDALFELMMSEEGIPQADMGDEDNGWYFTRENGLCRMYSFNDPLVLQVDPANPLNTVFRFQLIDGTISEPDGAQVQLIVALRDKPTGQFTAFPSTLTVSQGMPATYVLPVQIKQLVADFPNGFQLVLADMNQQKIMESDTLGSRKHLAALAQCARG